jgi:hypothetical protein
VEVLCQFSSTTRIVLEVVALLLDGVVILLSSVTFSTFMTVPPA